MTCLKNSGGKPSGPAARLFLSFLIAASTSLHYVNMIKSRNIELNLTVIQNELRCK